MARYDEDDRNRRSTSGPPARRESLMQRRLRHARGEAVDEDDNYYSEYEDEESRAYGPQMYEPRPTGPGGCAGVTLYLVLGALAIFLILILVSQQTLNAVMPNINLPQQIERVIASPTPVVRDLGGTIQQIRSLNRLETQNFSVERVIEAGVEGNAFQNLLFGDRILLIASGNVSAGIDLSRLEAGDIELSEDGNTISIQLPQSEIFDASLDNDRTRVYDREQGLLAAQNQDLETQARQAAEAEILQAACEGEIMQRAADEAVDAMEQFLRLLEFESITVTAEAGECIDVPTVPTLPTVTVTVP
ncbi:MAG: DUF4230 domain-containing protein [Chloroflexi bacterium AL-W]|nr:DUF4230 domain-containing protein [Chloroflexi bacterium AL-N1]NOK69830.1 DUF4230 domain-containing protein [Chloroflexi bacterium AL-N10]NOK73566.1 DUF4230 domain-containing protein [Chloroflexi bacterium AL-N5]NOK84000.1 DUF4230 domain-containing protein [Chloroflexi bacterium AL-W]NOK87897.1 DUF4230 domain-containing protein [Chloroflexi bacterium AL-N15]